MSSRFVLFLTADGKDQVLVNADEIAFAERVRDHVRLFLRSERPVEIPGQERYLDVSGDLQSVQAALMGVTVDTLDQWPNLIGWTQQYPAPSSTLPGVSPGCQVCGEPHGVSVPCGFRRAGS